MNIKDILFVASFVLLMGLGYQYFFGASQTPAEPGAQVFTVSHSDPDLVAPLDKDTSFTEVKVTNPKATLIETAYGQFSFSTEGAAIDHIQFKREQNNRIKWFDTFSACGKENRMFLLAFDEEAPYHYTLVSHKESDDFDTLTYRAQHGVATIVKEFAVYKKINKIDVRIALELPKGTDKRVRARLLMPSPKLVGQDKNTVDVFFQEGGGSIKIYKDLKEVANQLFGGPLSLFGLADRYFAYSLIQDADNFAQRAYTKTIAADKLIAIFQSKWISESTTWNMSFYLGPKDPVTVAAVDPRLETILDFGFFSWFGKLMLAMLNWLTKYTLNYGLAIILFTVLLKIFFLPFTWRAEAGKNDKKQKDFNRKRALLNEKYKNDPQRLQQEQADLIRKHGIPGTGACLPALLQLPIIIGLSAVLRNSIELYEVPFLWIKNLAGTDPYYILPVFVGIATYLHMQSMSKDPKMMLMPYMMGILSAVFMANWSAGVVLYFFTSTFLGVIQARAYKLLHRPA